MTNNVEKKLTKKDLNSVFWRWSLNSQNTWNYETYQGIGYGYAMLPVLKKIYKDEEKLKEAVKIYSQFFNTNCHACYLILGLNCALEENEVGIQEITNIKTSLMGPLAGIGDTLFVTIPQVIFGSIAGYMAIEGSALGIFLWLAFNFALKFVDMKMFMTAYEQGTKIVTKMGSLMKQVINLSSVVGLTVIGGMIPSFVNFKTGLSFTQGELLIEIQPYLDKIMPSFLPVCLVAIVYWLMGKKGVTPVKMMFALMAIGIAASYFGILI